MAGHFGLELHQSYCSITKITFLFPALVLFCLVTKKYPKKIKTKRCFRAQTNSRPPFCLASALEFQDLD